MRRANIKILIIVCLLLASIAVLAFLNRGDAALKRALQENRVFLLKTDGETVAEVNLRGLLDMEPVEFTTRLASSGTVPRDVKLKGVELRLVYEALGMGIPETPVFAVRGLDGYYSPLSRDEVAAEETVYICVEMDGELLREKSEGGWGPYLMVIRGSSFAQRWCKYVEEIDART